MFSRWQMFTRPPGTYNLDASVIERILKDESNPLNQIYRLIPDQSKVLDLGAGNGLLGYIIRTEHRDIILDGVEPDAYAAKIARNNYRKFYAGTAQEFLYCISSENYDYIILADVIEHIENPWEFLRDLSEGLGETTRIVLSVPNIAFGAVRLALMDGDFTYTDSGLIERTHVRFFTMKTLMELISSLGLFVEKLFFLQKDIDNSEVEFDIRRVPISTFLRVVRDELSFTYQFLAVLVAGPTATQKRICGSRSKVPVLKFLLGKFGLSRMIRRFLR
jgi:methionine biosynthesis protein MetW